MLAVERGDASQAPEGWTYSHNYGDPEWYYRGAPQVYAVVDVGRPEVARWRLVIDYVEVGGGEAETSLEAMEAADAARKEVQHG